MSRGPTAQATKSNAAGRAAWGRRRFYVHCAYYDNSGNEVLRFVNIELAYTLGSVKPYLTLPNLS